LLAAFAVVFAAAPAASAGCPGCEEYNLDLPNDNGGGSNPSAPAAPAAPAPAAVPTAPTTTTPATTVPVAPTAPAEAAAPEKKPKPVDTDPDPIPGGSVKPVSVQGIPAVAATQVASAQDPGTGGGVLPLVIALAAIGVIGLALGLRRNRAAEG
jgi:hypothetical protein